MKKSFLLLPIAGAFAFITLCSDSGGKSGNLTGSIAGSGCGTCHGSSADTTVHINFELDSLGVPVTRYKPGGVYVLKLIGKNMSSTATLPKFGFQMVAVKGTGTTQAGTWSTIPTGASTHTSSSISVMGHNTPNTPSSGTGGSGTVYTVTCGWTAPAAGSGTVTVHAVLNAVNGNGSDDNGDNWNIGSGTFGELPTVSAVETVSNLSSVKAYPNPVSSVLNLDLGNDQAGSFAVSVFDLSGKLVVSATSETAKVTLNTTSWNAGVYYVNIAQDGVSKSISVVKQ